MKENNADLAGVEYWEQFWETCPLPPPLDLTGQAGNDYLVRRLLELFAAIFRGTATRGKKLLEVGCGGSVLLPCLARTFGFEVSGLDYSHVGCDKAQKLLERERVHGKIHCADFRDPPRELLGEFDVVLSVGVLEHFEHAGAAVKALYRLLGPDGILVTIVPNLAGSMGILQKMLDRKAYDLHVPHDRASLFAAHSNAGLEVLECRYFLAVNLGVLNADRWRSRGGGRTVFRVASRISRSLRAATDRIAILRPNRWTSPYIVCVARRRRGAVMDSPPPGASD
jgi:2-polyprenyl-3-methyl-5-hydroxy-6-metoxy-1,4-benzoquinol methylase